MITVWQGTSNPITHDHQQAVAAWLRDNAIDPKEVVAAQPIRVDGAVIRFSAFLLGVKGTPQLNGDRTDTLQEDRVVPLVVPWSAP